MTDMDQDVNPHQFLSALVKIDVTLGKVNNAQDHIARQLERAARQGMAPVNYRPGTSGIGPSSGKLTLDLGSPDQGHVWHIRRIVVGGVTPTTTTLGTADVFITAAQPDGFGLLDWCDEATALPSIAFYGVGEMVVRAEDHLYVIVTTPTSGQTYVASAQVLDYQEAAYSQQYDL